MYHKEYHCNVNKRWDLKSLALCNPLIFKEGSLLSGVGCGIDYRTIPKLWFPTINLLRVILSNVVYFLG